MKIRARLNSGSKASEISKLRLKRVWEFRARLGSGSDINQVSSWAQKKKSRLYTLCYYPYCILVPAASSRRYLGGGMLPTAGQHWMEHTSPLQVSTPTTASTSQHCMEHTSSLQVSTAWSTAPHCKCTGHHCAGSSEFTAKRRSGNRERLAAAILWLHQCPDLENSVLFNTGTGPRRPYCGLLSVLT